MKLRGSGLKAVACWAYSEDPVKRALLEPEAMFEVESRPCRLQRAAGLFILCVARMAP